MSTLSKSAEWVAAPEAGDRFEIDVVADAGGSWRLHLPPELGSGGIAINAVEDETGRLLDFEPPSPANAARLRWPGPPPAAWDTAWLEYRSGGRFKLVLERRVPPSNEETAGEAELPIRFDPADERLLTVTGDEASAPQFELALRGARLATHAGFDRLIGLPMLREMELLDHQVRTATTVLRRLRGRALLCDEVGLGKTVEAGLVLSELLIRGLVRSVLILTPPSLIDQWQGEMRRKFSLNLTNYDDVPARDGARDWGDSPKIIASIHTAKREPHRGLLLGRTWDMVIIDEAHHLRNRTTQVWKFASELRKQFILLLTATPVQNSLDELFNLVTLLEPGLLSTQRDFQRRFMAKGDKLTPKNVDELHELLGEVMVRNRRSTVGLQFTRRWAKTETVTLSAPERELYDAAAAMVRERLRQKTAAAGLSRMTLILLQMALGSSAPAAASMLRNLLDKPILPVEQRRDLLKLCGHCDAAGTSAKAERLLGLLSEFPDKLVVFTQFRATQQMLYLRLIEAGFDVAMFHGGLSRMEKEAAIEHFRGPARVLLATESGSEGRNLQFAQGVCNFDLPWNPMKIEQRVGRLSRIGQTRDVHVFNLVAQGTVESAVLHLLEAKLNMFELVIGEVDMILGNLDEEKEFQDVVADLWTESADTDEFSARMEVLGNRLLAAKVAYFRQRAQDQKLFADRFAPDA